MKLTVSIIVFVMLYCVAVWMRHTENVSVFLNTGLPAGQGFYLASKILALLALTSLVLQVILMFIDRYANLAFIIWNRRSHYIFGLITFTLVVAHSISFFIAASLRSGSPAFALLLPNFNSGLYNAAVSIGLLAFYLSFFLILFGVVSRKKHAGFRRLHRCLVWMVLSCVLVHSIAIGSESKTWPMLTFYVVSLFLFIWLIFRKHRHKMNDR